MNRVSKINSSTSVKKLFCATAAISGSTGPATVEYHEKPTGTQSDLVKTSLINANPVLLRVLCYLTSRARRTKVTKIFTVNFGGKKQGHSYLYAIPREAVRQAIHYFVKF